jgi:hypothetical protein
MYVRSKLGFSVAIVIALIAGLVLGHANAKLQNPPPPRSNLYPLMGTIDAMVTNKVGDYTSIQRHWVGAAVSGVAIPVDGYGYHITTDSYPNTVIYAPAFDNCTITCSNPLIHAKRPKQSLAQIATALTMLFGSNAFEQQTINSTTQLYTKGLDTCTEITDSVHNSIQVSCSSPLLRQQLAAQAMPFVAAYIKSNRTIKVADITFGPLTIKSQNDDNSPITASKTAGYDIAEAVIRLPTGGPSIALYYEESHHPWHYVTSAASEFQFSCVAIDGDATARIALTGQICYNDTTKTLEHVH